MKKFFLRCLLFSLFFHLLAVVFTTGFHRPDEHLGIIRFMATKLGMFDVSELHRVNWEWRDEIRAWWQPAFYYLILAPFKALGLKNPFALTMILRFVSSAIGFLAMLSLTNFVQQFFKKELSLKALFLFTFGLWWIPFFHARTTAENFGASSLVFAILILVKKLPSSQLEHISLLPNFKLPRFSLPWGHSLLGGFLLGLTVHLRIPTGPTVIFFLLWLWLYGRLSYKSLFLICLGGLLNIGATVLVDTWGYGHLCYSLWNYLYAEFKYNVSRGFGVDPWWKYISIVLLKGVPPLSLVVFFSALWTWYKKPGHFISWITFSFFAFHSITAHKEGRFIFCLTLFVPFFVATVLDDFSNKDFFAKIAKSKWSKAFLFILVFQSIVLLFASTLRSANSQMSFYKHLYLKDESIDVIYNFNVIRDQLKFYQKAPLKLEYLSDISFAQEKLKSSGVFWFLTDKYSERELLLKDSDCRLDYSAYLELFYQLQMFKKQNNWHLIRCEKK